MNPDMFEAVAFTLFLVACLCGAGWMIVSILLANRREKRIWKKLERVRTRLEFENVPPLSPEVEGLNLNDLNAQFANPVKKPD